MKALLVIVFCSLIISSKAQTLTPSVNAAAGGQFSTGTGTLEWTLGEIMTETFQQNSKYLTHGFHQPTENSLLKSDYASRLASPLWKSSGTWKFTNEEATIMKLDDTQEVEIKILPDDFIALSLQWDQDTFTPGRLASVKGKQKFKLKKK